MNDDAEKLRDAFVSHEYLAPDPAAVYAGAKARARVYRRRRRTAQAAGGAVLGAGVVAASVNLPGWLEHARQGGAGQFALAGGPAAVTPSPLTPQEQQRALNAYFAAGYGYTDAQQLAKLWNVSSDIVTVKAEAGRRLLAGQTLPVQPHPNAGASAAASVDPQTEADVNAFFNAGYTYDDAVRLAQLWKTADPYHAKIQAGAKLLAGQALPFAPNPSAAASASAPAAQSSADLQAYFNAGYDSNDAVQLAKLWNISDLSQVKIDAGAKLLAGQPLPIPPSGTPAPSASVAAQNALNAYFNAGYTYNDAVRLAQLWNSTDVYQTKIDAGNKLLAGQTLPIAP
jgi:hypothetical protein